MLNYLLLLLRLVYIVMLSLSHKYNVQHNRDSAKGEPLLAY